MKGSIDMQVACYLIISSGAQILSHKNSCTVFKQETENCSPAQMTAPTQTQKQYSAAGCCLLDM